MKRLRFALPVAVLLLAPWFAPPLLCAAHPRALEPDPAGLIPRRSLDLYSRLLHLAKDQSESAAALYDGYATAFRTAAREYRTECSRIFKNEETRSPERTEHLAAARKSHVSRVNALEQSFFSDMQALLSKGQATAWPTVERARRREKLLPGVISGESVDLTRLVETLRLGPTESAPLAEPLAAYEIDLDRALLAKQRVIADDDPLYLGFEYSAPKLIRQTAAVREAGITIRDVNDRYAHQLELALPEARRAEFRDTFRRAAFPGIYSPTAGSRLLAAAVAVTDLDQLQRDSLDSLRKSYEHDLADANAKYEAAIRETESSNQAFTVPKDGGGTIQVLVGKPSDNPVWQAREARSELDARIRDRLESLLRPAQLDTLPSLKDLSTPERRMMDDRAVMIDTGD